MNAGLLVAVVLAVLAGAVPARAELYVRSGNQNVLVDDAPATPARPRPVLFVHGHNLLSASDSDFNFRKNWQDALGGLPSFQMALDLADNDWLGIEAYYIRLVDQNRSIVEDAAEIAAAVQRILRRHDPAYDPTAPGAMTAQRLAIVSYSKGTISSRLYLKSLQQPVTGLPASPGFNPVTEFVAISPPNHALASSLPTICLFLATKQLNNGYRDDGTPCLVDGGSLNFITDVVNGHPMADTLPDASNPSWTLGSYPGEAPGSRASTAAPSAGTLYLALYASAANPDVVGGHDPRTDFQGRVLARNLAPDAVNQPVAITGNGGIEVHQNTVHTPEVICRALYMVAHQRRPPDDLACPTTAVSGTQVPRLPPRTAVRLVLDLSGSMLGPACPTCASRLDVLKDAVELFTQLWSAAAHPGDRLGVTYFHTTVSAFTPAGAQAADGFATLDQATAVVDDVRMKGTQPANMTAMGAGLLDGIAALGNPLVRSTPGRHIVLFTDGMQNVAPLVSTPPPPLTIGSQPLDGSLGLRVHAIGVGSTERFQDLLDSIASATGGTSRLTTAPDADLNQYFTQTLVDALQAGSPQLLAYRRGTLTAGTVEAIGVGRGVRRLTLELSWRRGDRVGTALERDGVPVTPTRTIEGAFYRVLAVEAPAPGTYRLRIFGKAGTAYELGALADEPAIRHQLVLRPERPVAGEPLEIALRLLADGRPSRAAVRVTATVRRPAQSPGTLLSFDRTPVPAGFALEGSGPSERKLQVLLAAGRGGETRRIALALLPRGDGWYAATLRDTAVAGTYQIVVDVEGEDLTYGPIARQAGRAAVVRLAALGVGPVALHEGVLSLRPRDREGNYLGPGQADRISVTAGSASIGTVEDAGDGRYLLALPGSLPAGARIRIALGGRTLFEGTRGQLEAQATPWLGQVGVLLALLTLAVLASVVRLRQQP